MKLREILRPQINEAGIGDTAKQWWTAQLPMLRKLLVVGGTAMIVYDVYDSIRKTKDIDCTGMPDNECTAAQIAIWTRLIAHYGVGAVLFWVGALAGGFIGGPASWATAPIGGIVAFLVAENIWGHDVDHAANWIVKKITGMDTNRPIKYPVDKEKSNDYKPDPKQQAYRQGQVGLDTANNPDPRKHPERYPAN